MYGKVKRDILEVGILRSLLNATADFYFYLGMPTQIKTNEMENYNG